jgi:hypothetical protein
VEKETTPAICGYLLGRWLTVVDRVAKLLQRNVADVRRSENAEGDVQYGKDKRAPKPDVPLPGLRSNDAITLRMT